MVEDGRWFNGEAMAKRTSTGMLSTGKIKTGGEKIGKILWHWRQAHLFQCEFSYIKIPWGSENMSSVLIHTLMRAYTEMGVQTMVKVTLHFGHRNGTIKELITLKPRAIVRIKTWCLVTRLHINAKSCFWSSGQSMSRETTFVLIQKMLQKVGLLIYAIHLGVLIFIKAPSCALGFVYIVNFKSLRL